MSVSRVIGVVLAGGRGNRLTPLTDKRAKPAVPFAGNYRLIDMVLSNYYNSLIHNLRIVTQYVPRSLEHHLHLWERNYLGSAEPSQMRLLSSGLSDAHKWYEGTADAIRMNLRDILGQTGWSESVPDIVNIFAGDHVCFMEISQMNHFHTKNQAELTIAGLPVPYRKAVDNLGVFLVQDGQLLDMMEKPSESEIERFLIVPESLKDGQFDSKDISAAMAGKMIPITEVKKSERKRLLEHAFVYASMGNYAWRPDILEHTLMNTHATDFGLHIIPELARRRKVFVYNFLDNDVPGIPADRRGQWHDVGRLKDYFDIQMSLLDIDPLLNLYNPLWPIRTPNSKWPPSKIITAGVSYMSSDGAIVTDSTIIRSIIGPGTKIQPGAYIENTIIFGRESMSTQSVIGRGVMLYMVIADRDVNIPDGWRIGYDKELDVSRGFVVTDGITIVPKGYTV